MRLHAHFCLIFTDHLSLETAKQLKRTNQGIYLFIIFFINNLILNKTVIFIHYDHSTVVLQIENKYGLKLKIYSHKDLQVWNFF